MTQAFSIRRATLQDVEALVSLRLKLQQESGHLTEGQALSDLRRATQQYLLEALPTEAFLVWVAEVAGQIVATSGLLLFHKPTSRTQSVRDGSLYLEYVHAARVARARHCNGPSAHLNDLHQTDEGPSHMDVRDARWQASV